MARGIEGRDVFVDEEDRTKFLEFLRENLKKSGCACHAWTLMSNHYHLLIQTAERPLCDLMRPLNTRYALYHARKHGRRGYLFQDRFKSITTQDQYYVKEIIRYVHLNPLRAGICDSLEVLDAYPWSSHAVIMSNRNCDFMDSWIVLRRFGRDRKTATFNYWEFIASGVGMAEDTLIKTIRMANAGRKDMFDPGCWVIGDPEFVKAALAADKTNRIRLARYRVEGVLLDSLAGNFCKVSGITKEQLQRRSRGSHLAALRHVFAHLCRREYGFPVNKIGEYLGVGGSPATLSIAAGDELAKKKPFVNIVLKVRP